MHIEVTSYMLYYWLGMFNLKLNHAWTNDVINKETKLNKFCIDGIDRRWSIQFGGFFIPYSFSVIRIVLLYKSY